jgi:hypothetical protein
MERLEQLEQELGDMATQTQLAYAGIQPQFVQGASGQQGVAAARQPSMGLPTRPPTPVPPIGGGPGGSHRHRQGLQQDLLEEEGQDHPEEEDHNHRVDRNPWQGRHNPRQDHQASKLPLMEGGLWVNHQSSSPET